MGMENLRVGVIARVGAHDSLRQAGAVPVERRVSKTPFGNSNPIHLMEVDGLPIALLSRHGEKGYEVAAPWVNDRANLFALKDLGVEKVVSFSSPGSLDTGLGAGDLFLPDDVLDERREGPFSFFEGMGIGVIRMAQPFCPGLSARYAGALRNLGLEPHEGGVYVGTQGPRLETPVEIRKLRFLGGTAVGMTLVPEVFLARELELCYAAVCLVVNQAEGMKPCPVRTGVLFEGLADEGEMNRVRAMEARAGEMILAMVREAATYERTCACGQALERYRIRKDIGSDWRTWWD